MQIKIQVVKGGDVIEVDTDKLPEDVYIEVMAQGLKHFVNGSMTKVTASAYPSKEAKEAAAMEIAQKNVEKIYSGDIRFTATQKKKSGASGAEKTLALQEAKVLVKEEMKRQGIKVSYVEAKEITRCAHEVLEGPRGPELYAKAAAVIAARAEQAAASGGLGIVINISEKKVKQASEKAARTKAEKAAAKEKVAAMHPGTFAAKPQTGAEARPH
jgi:hypothetical protein